MNAIKNILLYIALLIVCIPIGNANAGVENITIETSRNNSFILSQPKIQSTEDITEFITQAHDRLIQADRSLVTEAVVSLVTPVKLDAVEQLLLNRDVSNVSIRGISNTTGENYSPYPFQENETERFGADFNVISLRLTADIQTLNDLTSHSNILCVDVGAIELLVQHTNAIIIVQEDLYQSSLVYNYVKKELSGLVPKTYSLSQNYPNPFNPSTEISFSLPEATKVKLEIYNTLGQLVHVLVEGELDAGTHSYEWDGSNIASGMYLYRLTADDFVSTKKMLLLK